MRSLIGLAVTVLFLSAANAQQPAPLPSGNAGATTTDRAGIDAALTAYTKAYQQKSLDNLLAIWPDLANQKKDYKKAKDQFTDPRITSIQMSLQPMQTQATSDSAVVQAERTLEMETQETESEQVSSRAGIPGAEGQGPVVKIVTRHPKKTDKVWIKLHRNGAAWTITSISDKPQTP